MALYAAWAIDTRAGDAGDAASRGPPCWAGDVVARAPPSTRSRSSAATASSTTTPVEKLMARWPARSRRSTGDERLGRVLAAKSR